MEVREPSAKYLARPGYKQTEVGMIPEDWKALSAFDACSKIQDGTHFSPRIKGNDYFYVTSKNIRFGYLDMSTASRIDAAQHREIYRRCDVKKGDLLLTKDGANTGNATLNPLEEEFSLLSSVAFLRFHQSKHCAAFFMQQILTSQGQRQIQDAMAGNAITRLTLEKINKLRFPAPPTKAEQEAIVEALSDADALIESLEQILAKKRNIKKGAMQELLTGKKRLPGFSGEWGVKRLGEVGSFLKGSGVRKDESLGGDLPCIRYGEIYTKHSDYIKAFHSWISADVAATAKRLKQGDLLFAGSGETKEEIGKSVAFVDDMEAYAGGDIVILRPENSNATFLGYYLNTAPINRQKASRGQGDAVVHISSAALSSIEITIPKAEEQTAIAAILSDMDAEIAALEGKLAKARSLKQGMMQELLTGRIRLV